MMGKNSLRYIIAVIILCLAMGWALHRWTVKPMPSFQQYQDSITYYTNEQIRIQDTLNKVEESLTRLDSAYHALADSIRNQTSSQELQRKRVELYNRIKVLQDRLDSLPGGQDNSGHR